MYLPASFEGVVVNNVVGAVVRLVVVVSSVIDMDEFSDVISSVTNRYMNSMAIIVLGYYIVLLL